MADNTTLNAGSGGDVIRDIDKSGKKTQVVTLDVGGSGAESLISGSVPISDGGNSITVDGSVTVTQGTATNLKVDASGVAVPVTDNSGSLTVDNAGTFAVQAAATQSGTWTVQPGNTANTTAWKVDASSVAVPITDNSGSLTVDNGGTFSVQTSAQVPGTGATNLGKAEDAAHSSGDVGVMALGLRKDTPSAVAGTDGDYIPLIVDQTGRQYANCALSTTELMSAGAALTPKFAKITASSSGATEIVALVSSKKIRVLSWNLVVNAAVNVKWQSHVTPTDKTGLHYFAANGGISVAFNPYGHFETVAGEALDINLSGAVAVGGSLVYVEV